MQSRDWLFKVLLAISAVTIVSGLVQLIAPGFVLGIVGAAADSTSAHCFAIVGMFMALFGGMMLQAQLSQRPQPIPVFWAAMQKFGAFGAVGLGVMREVFAPMALGVAFFDLVTALLMLAYWRRSRTAAGSWTPRS